MRRLSQTARVGLILLFLSAWIAGCASSQPTEQPLPQPTVTMQDVPEPTQPAAQPAPSGPPLAETPAEDQGLAITILYDNTAHDARLRAEWGFAALIEYGGHTVLFDTGGDGSILMGNMAQLGIDPQAIDAIVLSHIHDDHTNGLQSVLDTGITPTVYVPSTFPAAFKRNVQAHTDLVEVADPVEIFPGLHSTGELGSSIVEQALVVETKAGIVVITGCAHPGIVQIVRRAKAVAEGQVALVIGGFHLLDDSSGRVKQIVADLRELEVRQACPTHCTGDVAIAIFAAEYGDDYVQGGVGRVITVAAADGVRVPGLSDDSDDFAKNRISDRINNTNHSLRSITDKRLLRFMDASICLHQF